MNILKINKSTMSFLLFCVSVLVSSQGVFGAYWTEDRYTHFSKEEPLSGVLKAMAEQQGSHIVISNKVVGSINAYYRNESTINIFRKIKQTYNLVSYNDGDTLYVYSMSELKKVSIKMKKSPVSHLEQELLTLGVLNKSTKEEFGWVLNAKANNVTFRAVPRFIQTVRNIANELEENDYIYKWKDRDNIIHYSNEPPFSGVKYMKIMKIENRDIKDVPSAIDLFSNNKETTSDTILKGSKKL